MPSDQKTSIPAVPVTTAMFEEDMDGDRLLKHLTRTWIIFFERIGKVSTSIAGLFDSFDRYVFGLGNANNISVGTSATGKITAERKTQLQRWRITANIAPVGSSIIVDIKQNGVSIFPAGTANMIVLPASQTKAKGTVFLANPQVINYEDELLPDVLQVGSTTPGFRITIQIVGKAVQ